MGIGRDEERYRELLEEELNRMVLELRELGAEKIILFGSYARGRSDMFTDLDLIVILNTSLPFVERIGYVYSKLAPRVATDILIYTPEEWQKMKDRPFIQQALAEGRVIY
ncbi:MAG: nucleotidyltransferase domain-containing protein [Thermanaeromonas sp.]|uniref:nucleotidyltransferase domain-containing protein n=1 Tax=Thermanaeromonas sp. TaxID=2003697 RepID=UPI00243E7D72|nr:nucleotidyltransferase domain-containing protein [Thermanaeromonas sp.]MCG0278500.1 nucleotidyltransferase domain-containing protein [Thermanaeromonas sp.]